MKIVDVPPRRTRALAITCHRCREAIGSLAPAVADLDAQPSPVYFHASCAPSPVTPLRAEPRRRLGVRLTA